MTIRRRILDTPAGPVQLVADDDAMVRVRFPGDPLDEIPDVTSTHKVLDLAARELSEYFEGTTREFTVPIRLTVGTSFEHEVWLALATIPYGETISYGTQAARIGRAGASRAVGAANGRNPLPLILPCHRVVGSDGSLVGFGGGLALKQSLLDLESGVQQLPLV